MLRVLAALAFLLLLPSEAAADLVAVRHPEGMVYGALALSSTAGEGLAHGELIQTVRSGQVESRLVFRFADGSLHDERVVFTQQKVFSLLRYHLVQRGPAFPSRTEVTFDRGSGRYLVRPITRKAIRYLVKLELTGMLGVVATIVGKDPPDLRYWILAEPVPAFVKFEGPFFLNGPVWRIELTGPRWPGSSPRAK